MSAIPTHNRRSVLREREPKIRMSAELLERLEAAARAAGVTRNRYVVELLEGLLPPLLVCGPSEDGLKRSA
ncbi:hypothetical protein [Frankia sp. CiP3]|uniref:hypothetical protein n=1 Tax=Frankia sp. CiP3 TaxID=2880971 RepID=UPI001EF6D939|nr:hypothetical protein [Frankia sp. CiP3]